MTLAERLLASPRHRLVYRPHPRSGVLDPAYRAAHERIVAAITTANAADPAAHHVYDDGPELGWQLADADVAVTDISAMIYDRLAVGKPLIVTRPAAPGADVDERGYLGDANWLHAADAGDVVARVDAAATDAEELAKLRRWVQHYFGDTTPGVATARLHAAVDQLVARWHEEAAARGVS